MTYQNFISSFSLDRRIPIYFTLLSGILISQIYYYFQLSPYFISSSSSSLPAVTTPKTSTSSFILSSIPFNLQSWYFYVAILAFFHLGEYTLTAWYQPHRVNVDSFLLNHSRPYHIAVSIAILEYWLERTYGTNMLWLSLIKTSATSYTFYIGCILVSIGQLCRILAMSTAGSNFSHLIVDTKDPSHQLVTHGIYSILRHPAYTGWFYWSIGTQCILGNPICIIIYTIVSWKFFADRIPYEEYTLLQFFQWNYVEYAKKTYILIPFIQSPAATYHHHEDNNDNEIEKDYND